MMSIEINMNKARDIWKDKWRVVREPLLKDLDVEFMRATELADAGKQAEIATKKQELRDVTNVDLTTASTTDQLKLMWPECLGDKPEELK